MQKDTKKQTKAESSESLKSIENLKTSKVKIDSQEEHENQRKLAKKILNVQKKIRKIAADQKNTQQNYSYVSAGAVVNEVNEAFSEESVIVSVQDIVVVATDIEVGKMKKDTVQIFLKIEDVETGAYRIWKAYGSGADMSDKAIMKAQTSSFKYALILNLLIAKGHEDPEKTPKSDNKRSKWASDKQQNFIKTNLTKLGYKTGQERLNEIAHILNRMITYDTNQNGQAILHISTKEASKVIEDTKLRLENRNKRESDLQEPDLPGDDIEY